MVNEYDIDSVERQDSRPLLTPAGADLLAEKLGPIESQEGDMAAPLQALPTDEEIRWANDEAAARTAGTTEINGFRFGESGKPQSSGGLLAQVLPPPPPVEGIDNPEHGRSEGPLPVAGPAAAIVQRPTPSAAREGSPENLARRQGINDAANSYKGSTAWALASRKDNFPKYSNKCSKYVCDVLQEAGAPISVSVKGIERCARAGELANPHWNPPNWRQLRADEKPEPGDVAAYPLKGGEPDYSGHTGVITNDPGGNMSAHEFSVGAVPGQFDRSAYPPTDKVIYRRYIGG